MSTTPRYDIYAFIHKGLRAFMAHALLRAGRCDSHDAAEVAVLRAEVGALMDICAAHLAHENKVIHAAIESRSPGACERIAGEHLEHQAAIAELRALLPLVPGNPAAAQTLYRRLAAFVAHNYEHMGVEESLHNEALWATHSDEEIHGLHDRIVGSQSPDEMQLALRWMLPHLNPAERALMLGGMRANAPREVFEGVLSLVRPLLAGHDWQKLSTALAL